MSVVCVGSNRKNVRSLVQVLCVQEAAASDTWMVCTGKSAYAQAWHAWITDNERKMDVLSTTEDGDENSERTCIVLDDVSQVWLEKPAVKAMLDRARRIIYLTTHYALCPPTILARLERVMIWSHVCNSEEKTDRFASWVCDQTVPSAPLPDNLLVQLRHIPTSHYMEIQFRPVRCTLMPHHTWRTYPWAKKAVVEAPVTHVSTLLPAAVLGGAPTSTASPGGVPTSTAPPGAASVTPLPATPVPAPHTLKPETTTANPGLLNVSTAPVTSPAVDGERRVPWESCTSIQEFTRLSHAEVGVERMWIQLRDVRDPEAMVQLLQNGLSDGLVCSLVRQSYCMQNQPSAGDMHVCFHVNPADLDLFISIVARLLRAVRRHREVGPMGIFV